MSSDYSNDFDETKEPYEPEVTLITIRLIICIFGSVGNILVIFIILVLREYKKTPTNWYVLQLAIADCLFLLTIPFKVLEDWHNEWIFSSGWCKAKETILFLNYNASIFFLVIMSMYSYIAVCRSFSRRLEKLRTPTALYVITVVVWLTALLLCIPIIPFSDKRGFDPSCRCSYEFPPDEFLSIEEQCKYAGPGSDHFKLCLGWLRNLTACVVVPLEDEGYNNYTDSNGTATVPELAMAYPDEWSGEMDYYSEDELSGDLYQHSQYNQSCTYKEHPKGVKAYFSFNFAVLFVIPLLVMSVCYSLIAHKLHTSPVRTNKNDRKKVRVTIICGVLVALFVVCWLPFHAYHLAKMEGIYGSDEYCNQIGAVVVGLAYLNSALNPLVYNFIGKKFLKRLRIALSTVLGKICTCMPCFTGSYTVDRGHSETRSSSGAGTVLTKIFKKKRGKDASAESSSGKEESSGGKVEMDQPLVAVSYTAGK